MRRLLLACFLCAAASGVQAQALSDVLWLRDGSSRVKGLHIYVNPEQKLAVVMADGEAYSLDRVDSVRVDGRFYRTFAEGSPEAPLYRLLERVHDGVLALFTMHPAPSSDLVASARFVARPAEDIARLHVGSLQSFVADDPQSTALVGKARFNKTASTTLAVVGAPALAVGTGLVVYSQLTGEMFGGSGDNTLPLVAVATGAAFTLVGVVLHARHRAQLRQAAVIYDGR